MRKLAFINIIDETKKLMIHKSDKGVFLYGYDCLQDTSSKWDKRFKTVEEAEEYCRNVYKVDSDHWISIPDPLESCQPDFIRLARVKGSDTGKPEYGKFETFETFIFSKSKWVDHDSTDKCYRFDGLTGNERLFVTGLMDEFDKAKRNDKTKARRILTALEFDERSIERIL